MMHGNRCEECRGDAVAGRWEPTHGPARVLCARCWLDAATRANGLPARPATAAEEDRLGEEVCAALQGQIVDHGERLGEHHRKLGDYATRLKALEDHEHESVEEDLRALWAAVGELQRRAG